MGLKIEIGFCKDCDWRGSMGNCANEEKICEDDWAVRGLADHEKADMLLYSYYEAGEFWVGPEFGCVHWVERS